METISHVVLECLVIVKCTVFAVYFKEAPWCGLSGTYLRNEHLPQHNGRG